jgi:hypothetical protein
LTPAAFDDAAGDAGGVASGLGARVSRGRPGTIVDGLGDGRDRDPYGL